jgi:hypothetical protein
VTRGHVQPSREWCSLRIRFDERELGLLRAAEQLRGASLSHQQRPDTLRGALALARAGQKVRSARPGASIVFEETELRLLVEAMRFAAGEIQWAGSQRETDNVARRDAVLAAFPELVERGLWRSFGLTREMDEVVRRIQGAVTS